MNAIVLAPIELEQLTGRKQRAAQRCALDRMGLRYGVRPDGSLAVLRAHVEAVLGGAGATMQPPRPAEPQLHP